MTGAIPLEGQVLLVVGVHDKVLAAHRRGLDRVLPRRNAKEIHEELGDDLRRVTAVEFVSHLDELLDLVQARADGPRRARRRALARLGHGPGRRCPRPPPGRGTASPTLVGRRGGPAPST